MVDTKKVYLNGSLVGEYRPTGENERDQELAVAVLREKGLWTETTLEQAMFRQAVSFATTASYLYKRDLTATPRNGMSVAPFVVNSAFALELYLKTVGQLHGQTMRGHDLLDLFDDLPLDARTALHQNFAKREWQCGIVGLAEFRKVLEELRSAFVDWRYLHERKRTGPIQLKPMIFAMEVLHETCKANKKVVADPVPSV